jgi:hypothetical protein
MLSSLSSLPVTPPPTPSPYADQENFRGLPIPRRPQFSVPTNPPTEKTSEYAWRGGGEEARRRIPSTRQHIRRRRGGWMEEKRPSQSCARQGLRFFSSRLAGQWKGRGAQCSKTKDRTRVLMWRSVGSCIVHLLECHSLAPHHAGNGEPSLQPSREVRAALPEAVSAAGRRWTGSCRGLGGGVRCPRLELAERSRSSPSNKPSLVLWRRGIGWTGRRHGRTGDNSEGAWCTVKLGRRW